MMWLPTIITLTVWVWALAAKSIVGPGARPNGVDALIITALSWWAWSWPV